MSGDFELKDEPILFYSDEMTATKLIALRHRGIKLHLYSRVMNKLGRVKNHRSKIERLEVIFVRDESNKGTTN